MSQDSSARRETKKDQIARTLRMQIQAGTLRDGEVLPPSRTLASEWGVSDYTINEAMQILVDEGLVVSKSRSNRVVNYPESAQRRHARTERPTVLLIGGFPGSGKTEAARILSRLTGWAILDKDTLTRPVVEAALELTGNSPHDRESETYFERIRPREYEALMAAGIENADCGNSSILAAPFIREFTDEAWTTRTVATLDARGARAAFAWIYCDEDTMHFYMRQRGAARDATKLADWPAYLGTIKLETRPLRDHFLLDNSSSSEPLQEQVQRMARNLIGPSATP
ncbi:MAG: GntR family transcriptional regulator [Actinobacteria bacterium]|nr:GntR family transcriptional regulator [Actinomycetota bacterium]